MVIYLKDFFLCTLLYTAKKSFFVSDSFFKFLAAVLVVSSKSPFVFTAFSGFLVAVLFAAKKSFVVFAEFSVLRQKIYHILKVKLEIKNFCFIK